MSTELSVASSSSDVEPIVSVECDEPEGTVVRSVRPARLTTARLKFYYERLKKFDVLFNDWIAGDIDKFIQAFVGQLPDGTIIPTGLVYEVDDVGIMYLTDIRPGEEAIGHFSFWDRRIKGRENLIREMLKYVMEQFDLHRVTVEVGLYAAPWLTEAVERMGFKREGRKREAIRYKGEWFDVRMYGILRQEVEELSSLISSKKVVKDGIEA